MKKVLVGIALAIASIHSYAQVGITDKVSIDVHPHANLQVDKFEGKSNTGVIIPSVSSSDNLPLNSSNITDPSMAGLLMYENTHATYYSYDGAAWNNEFQTPPGTFKNNRSRFLAKIGDTQKVDCGITVCGRHQGLKFSADIDGNLSYNNLNILREQATIKYGAINYDFENAKFVITEPGLYEITLNIPSLLVGVVSLTEAGRYQLRGYIKNADNTYSEQILLDFVPEFYNVLGIGGDGSAGGYASTQIRLKAGDYVVPRIDSPGVTISVGASLQATATEADFLSNPREISFTKISE